MWNTNADRAPPVDVLNHPNYVLRNRDELSIPPSRLSLTDRFPLIYFPKLWQSFNDENIKIQRSKPIFNSLLKMHFLNQLQSEYKCERLLCPHCYLS